MIRLSVLGHIRTALGRSELELGVEEMTVDRLLTMISSMPHSEDISIHHESTLVVVNGVEISALSGGKTVVKSGDEVALIPVVHGG